MVAVGVVFGGSAEADLNVGDAAAALVGTGDGAELGGHDDGVGVGDGVAEEVGLGLLHPSGHGRWDPGCWVESLAVPREFIARCSSDSMVSMRTVVAGDTGLGVAATAVWPMEVIATATRPARPAPAIATFFLFMGTGTRFACKIHLLPSVSEVLPIRAMRLRLPCRRLLIGRIAAG